MTVDYINPKWQAAKDKQDEITNLLLTKTPQEARQYVDNQITDLASAKEVIADIAALVIVAFQLANTNSDS